MICRNCGTEIADKAIVCYRCGTGTTEPVRKPAEIRRRRSPLLMVVIVVVLLLLAFFLARNSRLFAIGMFVPETGHVQGLLLIDSRPGNA